MASLNSAAAAVLRCAVCGEEPANPTTAPCQHNFCVACLGAWVRAQIASRELARCPLCRAPVEQDAARLAVNGGLRDVLAALAALRCASSLGAGAAALSMSHSFHLTPRDNGAPVLLPVRIQTGQCTTNR